MVVLLRLSELPLLPLWPWLLLLFMNDDLLFKIPELVLPEVEDVEPAQPSLQRPWIRPSERSFIENCNSKSMVCRLFRAPDPEQGFGVWRRAAGAGPGEALAERGRRRVDPDQPQQRVCMPAPEATGLGRSAPRAPIQKRHINPIYYGTS